MTRPVVLDASVGVALVHAEPESGRWRSVMGGWLREARPIVVPTHFWLESANTLVRRHRFGGAGTLEALHALDDVVTRTVEVDRPILLLAIDRAERFGLSVYDAAYLSLAESLDAELATMDRVLTAAAGDRAVSPDDHRRRLPETPAPYSLPTRVTWPDYAGAASYLAVLRADLRRGAGRA